MNASQSHRSTDESLLTNTALKCQGFPTTNGSNRCSTEDASDTSEYSDRYTSTTNHSTICSSTHSSHPQGEAFAVENSILFKDILEELEFERARRIQLEMELAERPSSRTSRNTNTQEQRACSSDLQSQNSQKDCIRSQHHLQIAFEINSIYGDSENIPKRLMYPILVVFFQKLYENTLKDIYGTDISNKVCPDAIKKGKDKRIKDAINRVYSECDSSMASKLMRVEYEKAVLKPALESVSFDFVNKLIAETDTDTDTSSSESSQSQPNQQLQQAAHAKNMELEAQLDKVKLVNQRNVKKFTTERDEYLALLDSLTSDNDAIVLASENLGFSLPLHQVRFLEIMPWDDRAQDFISVTEEITQWQAFDVRTNVWTDKKIKTDPFFQHLPINKTGTSSSSRKLSHSLSQSPVGKIQHAFDSFSLHGRILTDAACGHILDLTDGYSLPKNGTWEWVSNWTLSDNRGSSSSSNSSSASLASHEDEGWIYSETLEALLPVGGDLGAHYNPKTTSRFRKKTWQRRRVLISYPGISPGTGQMLKMNAHNAKLTLAVTKLHDQVHNMQNKLIQKDEELDRTTMSLMSQISAIEDELDAKIQAIESLRVQLFKTRFNANSNSNSTSPAKSLEKKPKPLLSLCDSSSKTKATDSTRQSSDSECTAESDDLVNMDIEIESPTGWLKSLGTMRSNVQTALVSSIVN